MNRQRFTLKPEHVLLLMEANISFREQPEWGAPGLDCKRPFGNSDLVEDMAKILRIPPVETDDEETHWPKGTRDRMLTLYRELEIALQIILATGCFEPGEYEADEYFHNWQPATRAAAD